MCQAVSLHKPPIVCQTEITIEEKYVLLREFFLQDDRTSRQQADYIGWFYTDEDEHRQEIDKLWQQGDNKSDYVVLQNNNLELCGADRPLLVAKRPSSHTEK